MESEVQHEPSEITYDESFYPARPRPLRPSIRRANRHLWSSDGDPSAANPVYVEWLREQSMLGDAKLLADAALRPGQHVAEPVRRTRTRARRSSARPVWFTAYPLSLDHRGRASRSWPRSATEELWQAFSDDRHRRRPHRARSSRRAGSTAGGPRRRSTATSTASACRSTRRSAPRSEFRRLCAIAAEYDGTVIDDIVPGPHRQGRRLPARRDGPRGLSRASTTWSRSSRRTGTCCPEVPDGQRLVNLDAETEAQLERAGYIIGRLQRVIFYEPGVKETNWSATPRGHRRRRASSGAGSTCTTSRRASRRSTGSTRPSPACGW